MSTVRNGHSRKESSSKGKQDKKVFSSIVLNAKGYLVEVMFNPGQSDANGGMFFARMNLLMGKSGDKFDYQSVSVLVGGKAKQVVEKLYESQSYEGERAKHALTGVVFDITINNVVLGTYESDSSVGVDFKGVLTELSF